MSTGSHISVCLLTFNHRSIVEETLGSVLRQSVRGFEFIVSDDHSTDGTWELIRSIAEEDPRIIALRTPRNLGMAGNANYAIRMSSRPFVALLHHDDLYRPDALQKWAAVLDRQPDVAFVFNAYAYAGDGTVDTHRLSERSEGKWFLRNHLLAGWGCPVRGTAMLRKSSWDAIGGIDEEFGLLADIDLWMRFSAEYAVGYVAEPLVTVRHQRPPDYPDEYRRFSWIRLALLYEIHATNRARAGIFAGWFGRLRRFWFRLRVTGTTLKWLAYATVRNRPWILATSHHGQSRYELWPARFARTLIRFWAARRSRVEDSTVQ